MTTDDRLPDNLARALKALDDDATRASARLDSARVAEGVLDQLRREPAARPKVALRYAGTMRIAAAVIVVVIGGVIAQRLAMTPVPAASDVAGLPVSMSADSMDAGQVTELLAAVEQVGTLSAGTDSAATTARTVSVDDLNEAELRTLLRIMEDPGETK